ASWHAVDLDLYLDAPARRLARAVVDDVAVDEAGLELEKEFRKARGVGDQELATSVARQHAQRARIEGPIAHPDRVQRDVRCARRLRPCPLGGGAAAIRSVG